MQDVILEFQHVDAGYPGQNRQILKNISFRIIQGEFITILGNSGSGKTTLLKLVNRLISPAGGRILFKGGDIAQGTPEQLRKNMGYVIQQAGLFPHMTVAENIAVLPKVLKWNKNTINARVDELLSMTKLPSDKEFINRHPWQLSGGQQQRVGIARALCTDPDILLMDEPFGALDAVTRKELQQELKQLHHTFGKTILFVTHDRQEAIDLGDRVMVLNDGEISQFDTPRRLIMCPANEAIRNLFHADTALKKLSYFKVSDFADLLKEEQDGGARSVEWDMPMETVLDCMLQGQERVLVYREGIYMGSFRHRDLIQADGYTENQADRYTENQADGYIDDQSDDYTNNQERGQTGEMV